MLMSALTVSGQEVWTVERCMEYAVEHNHGVHMQKLALEKSLADRTQAVSAFFPSASAGMNGQYNFGRAIDPETNTYTDVSTFYNGYSVQTSLPVFDGFSRLHALRAAKASVLMGRASLRVQQDQTALSVLQAFTDVAYYEGLLRMTGERVEEATLLLKQTHVLEEVGRKSAVDVAQMESQEAEACYEHTRQKGLYESALLELKKTMGYPLDDSLSLETSPKVELFHSQHVDLLFDSNRSPELQEACYQMQARKHEWRQARASLFPFLSLSAGLNTTYYKQLHSKTATSYSDQFKNNMGEYVGATLSIPLFNRLQTITNIRKAKNNYIMACEAYEQKQLELEKLSREAWYDWQGFLKQSVQMEKKVEADSLTFQLTRRQFEEGLSTAIDLRTTSAQLLNSRATLLQCRLMTMVKAQLVRYYKGEQIWTEK